MSELKIIPVTLKRYNELVDNGEIDETAFYKIVDDEVQKMTNLTDKLRKGELPDNHHYYFKLPKSKEYEVGNTFCLETLRWCKDGDKIEVIEEVPSYEKLREKEIMYDTTSRCNEKLLWENEELKKIIQKTKANGKYPDRISRLKSRVVALSEENTKLKTENKWYSEQLNEAVKQNDKLKEQLKECERLQKQLDIAVECLKTTVDLACPYFKVKTAKSDSFHQLKNIQKKCGIALQQIEELNNG